MRNISVNYYLKLPTGANYNDNTLNTQACYTLTRITTKYLVTDCLFILSSYKYSSSPQEYDNTGIARVVQSWTNVDGGERETNN